MKDTTFTYPKNFQFLDKDFTPHSLEDYQLRELLLRQGITIPEDASWEDCILLFDKYIVPRREALIRMLGNSWSSVTKGGSSNQDWPSLPAPPGWPKRDQDGFAIPYPRSGNTEDSTQFETQKSNSLTDLFSFGTSNHNASDESVTDEESNTFWSFIRRNIPLLSTSNSERTSDNNKHDSRQDDYAKQVMDPSRNQMDIANSVIDESINSAKKIYSLDAMISKLWPSQSHSSGDSGSPELEAEELVESYEWRRSPSLEAEEISADEAAEAARQEAEEQLQKANELRSLRTVLRQWRNPNLAPIGTNPTSVLERFAMLAKLFPDRNDLFFRNSPNESSSKEMVPHRFGSSTKELVRSSDRSIRSNAVSREVNYRPRGIYVPECDENELTYNGESLFSSEDESCADESEDYDSSDDSNYTPLDVDGTVSNDRFKEEKHSIDEDEVLGLFDDLKQHIYRIQPILDYTRDDSEYQETPPIIHVPKQNPIARYLRHAVQMSKNAKQSILLSIVPLTSILLMAMILICIARNRNGYCDSAKTLNRSIVDGEPIHHGFSLACIPCPPNGVCFFGELQCPTLYKRRRAWYNPFGFLPVADRCVLDAVVAKRVKLIERTIRRTLYAAQGKLLCDAVKKGNGDVTNTYASIHVDDLTQRLRNSKELISKMSKSQLEDLIPIALKSVLTNENIFYWNTDGNATYSTNKAYCTLGCRILLFYATMSIFTKFCLILGALLFCASLPFMYRLFISYKEKRQVNKLVSEIIKTLKNQHKKHSENPTENPHKYCSVPYLRVALMDSVNIKDVQKALSVWEKAERELQKSPNIIRRFLEENGEAYETWEYVA